MVLCLAALSGLAFWAVEGLDDETSASVKGAFSHVSAVTFTPDVQPDGGISPACGCFVPPVDSWQGVTFAGRELTLARTGRSKWTEWVLSAAEPQRTALQGGDKRLDVEILRLRSHGRFDPREALREGLAARPELVASTVVPAYRFNLLSRRPIKLGLLGDVPVGSWVPFPGSRVTLGKLPQARPFQPVRQRLEEHYPPDLGFEAKGKPRRVQAYPLGDFLGPDLVIWTRDPKAHVPFTSMRGPAGKGVITALIVRRSTFSTRIGAVPLSREELRITREARKPGEPKKKIGYAFFGRSDRGKVTLTVNEPLATTEYRRILRRLARDDVTAVRAYLAYSVHDPTGIVDPRGGWYTENQRYPPLPRHDGFNVFGPLTELRLDDVRGSLSVDDRTLALPTRSDVHLSSVGNLRDPSRQQQIPIPLRTADDQTNIEFSAVSRVRVDGQPQATFWKRHDGTVDLGFQLLGGLAALVGLGAAFSSGLWRPS